MLFGTNLDLLPGETSSIISATAISKAGVAYDLPVEFTGPVAGMSWLSDVIVRLPSDPSLTGDLSVSVMLRGVRSNTVTVTIGSQ